MNLRMMQTDKVIIDSLLETLLCRNHYTLIQIHVRTN